MEKDLGPSATKSDILLSPRSEVEDEEEDEEEEKKEDAGKSKGETKRWSSRFRCYEAYACSISCYSVLQLKCLLLSSHGIFALLPVIAFEIFVGIPVAIIQIMLGRYIMTNVSKSWSMHIMAKGILICETAVTFYYVAYGLAVTSFLVQYMFLSFTIPWTSCNTTWATMSCYESQQFQKFLSKCLEHNTHELCMNLNWKTSEMEYWKYVASNPYNTMNLFLQSLYSFLISVALFALVVKGVHGAEKSFTLFMIIEVVLSVFMASILCMSTEFDNGFKKIFVLNFDCLSEKQMWVEAYDTAIFTLGLGRLPLAFISSHANFEDDIFSEVLMVCFVYFFFSLLIIMPTFCVMQIIKSNNYTYGTTDGHLTALDIFVFLSEITLLFPTPNHVWATLYYLLLVSVTISSLCVSVLALVDAITGLEPDRFSTFYTSLIMCVFCYISSLIFIFYNFSFEILFDKSIVSILFLYLIVLEVFYGLQTFLDDFHFMMGYPVPFFLKLSWIISLPMTFIMIVLNAIVYCNAPLNTITYLFLGAPFLICTVASSVRIGMSIYQNKGVLQISNFFKQDPDWGPADPLYKKSRILFDSRAVTKEFMYRQELREKLFLKPPDISEQSIVHII